MLCLLIKKNRCKDNLPLGKKTMHITDLFFPVRG